MESVLTQEVDECFVHLKRRSRGRNTCFLLGQEDEKKCFKVFFIACLIIVSYHQHLKLTELWS